MTCTIFISSFLLSLLFALPVVESATHWVVTEDGKIHTQDDSVFSLRRPYDLVSLLQQEKRADALKVIKRQLLVQKETIEATAGNDDDRRQGTIIIDSDTDVEQVVYATNDDCNKAGKALPEFDLYVGTILFLPSIKSNSLNHNDGLDTNGNQEDRLIDERLSGDSFITKLGTKAGELNKPNCTEIYDLAFSMHTYEHLQSMRDRKNLEIEPETQIHSTISSIKDIEEYGNAIYHDLKQNNTSWVLYTMASFYWRAKGNGHAAVECLRRALHFCPYLYKHIPLASLGNVLHRAHHSEEAAIVIHHAIDVSSENSISHFTLGNIYAVLADYNKSLICYENVLKLDPSFTEARLRYHAVLCHQKVEKTLRAQHDSLQKTLEELQGYQKQQELWLQYQQKLLIEQAPPSVLLEQRLHYREHKLMKEFLGSNLNGHGTNGGVGGGSGGCGVGGASLPSSASSNSGSSIKKLARVTLENVGAAQGSRGNGGDISQSGISSNSALSSCAASCNKCNTDGQADCQMVPILSINFAPPS